MSWILTVKDDETGEEEVRIEYQTREACNGAFNGFRALYNMSERKMILTMHEDTQQSLNMKLDPALETIEAQRKHEAEEQRIHDLCEELEGQGQCTNLTPVGDEYDRNWGQCHVCDEWGVAHCDFGTAGSRALCEKHLNLASQDRLQTFINVYGTSRVYGGPEEGGWWYTAGEPVMSIPICDNMSNPRIEEMRVDIGNRIENKQAQALFDLLIWDGRYERYITLAELRPGRYFPLEVPHYE